MREQQTMTFQLRDRVRILRHDLTRYVGREGSIYSFAESAQGRPTAYVTLSDGGGLWVHTDDLLLWPVFVYGQGEPPCRCYRCVGKQTRRTQ